MATSFATPLTPDATVDQALDALHERGKDLRSLSADVELESFAEALGDDPDVRAGKLWLLRSADNDTRVRITFTTRTQGNRRFDEPKDYFIDGQRVIERDGKAKKETTSVIGKPGDKLDLFKLGEGPFPLPIGQPREDVLKNFDAALIALSDAADKPAKAVVAIKLTPKKGAPIASDFADVVVRIAADGWPVEIETVGAGQAPQTNIARLANVRANEAVDETQLQPPPIGNDWDRQTRER